jgi:hypothetical protein
MTLCQEHRGTVSSIVFVIDEMSRDGAEGEKACLRFLKAIAGVQHRWQDDWPKLGLVLLPLPEWERRMDDADDDKPWRHLSRDPVKLKRFDLAETENS